MSCKGGGPLSAKKMQASIVGGKQIKNLWKFCFEKTSICKLRKKTWIFAHMSVKPWGGDILFLPSTKTYIFLADKGFASRPLSRNFR